MIYEDSEPFIRRAGSLFRRGEGTGMNDDKVVWMVGALSICLISSLILYLEPSFPPAVIVVYAIEVFMYVNLFIYSRRLWEAPSPRRREPERLYQLEQDL